MKLWTLIRPLIAIACTLMLTRVAIAAPDAASIRSQITAMPLGANIEVRLKDKQKLRGARGAVAENGFTLVDARAGERPVAFEEVVSVKAFQHKSHTGRNILIGVGIGVAVVAIVIVALAHGGGYL